MGETANTPVFKRITLNECCGCEACINVCPKKCIDMKKDAEGFLYPYCPEDSINNCIQCYRCVNVCPVLHSKPRTLIKKTFAGYAKDNNIVKSSASGGMFSLLNTALNRIEGSNHAVCGVAWDKDFRGCHHEILVNQPDIGCLKSSKYVQSKKGMVFEEIEKLLKNEYIVLFSGTPCEVAALYNFLSRPYDNLYTVDIICQGPTSPRAMEEYIERIETRKNKRVVSVDMRYVKHTPWIPQWLKIQFEDKSQSIKLFYETEIGRAVHIMQRKSCYACKFNNDCHAADITIGDYHGADSGNQYYNAYGTSILVINTDKGKVLFDAIPDEDKSLYPVDYDDVASTNPRLVSSWEPSPLREKFSAIFSTEGLFAASNNSWSLRERIRHRIPYNMRMFVRNLRNKVGGGNS